MEKIKRFSAVCLCIVIAIVYRSWFGTGILSGGDVGMTFHAMYFNDYFYPYAWYWNQGIGLGGNAVSLLWIYLDFAFTRRVFGQLFNFPWSITERLAYFFPFLLLGFISLRVLIKYIFPKNLFAVFGELFYLVNSYILMVVGGGQLWIFLSYAIAPLVLYFFMNGANKIFDGKEKNFKKSLVVGLLFSFQLLLDLRIAYITLFAAFLYWLLTISQNRKLHVSLQSFVFVFLIPGLVTLFLHAFWILPTLIIGQNPLQQFGLAFTSTNAVTYFSFATFENSISLLHPNWPENIFGKVGFMKPEFLCIPILAFSSLFFTSKQKDKNNTYVLFFALLALIGVFLAKGTQNPFGDIYLWMFGHIPGFIMFRDPTKWYLLIALSYSLLIPFTIQKVYVFLQSHTTFSILNFQFSNKLKLFNSQNIFLFLVACWLLFLIRPALVGQLGGTLKTTQIPSEYITLERFLSTQNHFFRTFWFPTIQRFGLNSKDHPAISGQDFLVTRDLISGLNKLQRDENLLKDASVKYIIIPYDSEGEIFVKDRKYDANAYKETVQEMKRISYLKQLSGFGKIVVFAVSNPKDHFWSTKENLIKSYENSNPTHYTIAIQNAKKGDVIVFAETYDPRWIAMVVQFGAHGVHSTKYDGFLNSFVLEKSGSYSLNVYYSSQDWVDRGVWISSISFIAILGILVGVWFDARKMIK